MTINEAIEQLQINGTKEPLTISGNAIRMTKYFKALAVAEIALEKQIPKKPVGEWCPICNEVVDEHECNYKFDYCPNCGQKIDWSEVE